VRSPVAPVRRRDMRCGTVMAECPSLGSGAGHMSRKDIILRIYWFGESGPVDPARFSEYPSPDMIRRP
jgi:hypothetical protein